MGILSKMRGLGHGGIMKYSQCVGIDDLKSVNLNYKEDLTSDGAWIYPLPNMVSMRSAFGGSKKLLRWCADLPSVSNGNGFCFANSKLKIVDNCYIKQLSQSMFYNCRELEEVHADLRDIPGGYYSFAITPKLWYFGSELPKLTNGAAMFEWSILNKESALRILNSIPTYTSGSHSLTIGIHIDHQTDEEVLTAISNAESRGWTMTVQWNGTPTASTSVTYSLRKPSIYAKKVEIETPEGNTEEVLEWGHYVTNYEENGYQEFSSVEEAYGHFGLTPPQLED